MADDVWAWCEKAGAFGRTVTVKVKFADFRQITRSRSYPVAVKAHEHLRHASLELIRSILPPELGIRTGRCDRCELRGIVARGQRPALV